MLISVQRKKKLNKQCFEFVNNVMKKMKNIIEKIKTGTSEEVKEARKELDRLCDRLSHPLSRKDKKRLEIFLEEVKRFDTMGDIDHQVYFIGALKWPFLILGEEYAEFFIKFILDQIQHESGKVRQAIIHVVDWLLIGLDFNLQPFFPKKMSLKVKQQYERNRFNYCSFILVAEELLAKHHMPRFNRYKYVRSLPPSIYKSLQILITEKLLRTPRFEKAYKDFLKEMGFRRVPVSESKTAAQSKREVPERTREHLKRKRQIRQDLQRLLTEIQSHFTLEDIERLIYLENDLEDFKRLYSIFADGADPHKLNERIKIINDAWNYFPHQCLGGKSPVEIYPH